MDPTATSAQAQASAKKSALATPAKSKTASSWTGTHVGHLSYIGDSIFGEHCNLGAGTVTANYRLDEGSIKMMVKDQMVNTGRRKLGAVFGDNVKTGIKSLFMPGVKVGANSWVGANFMVERDLPADTMAFQKQNCSIQEKKKKQ